MKKSKKEFREDHDTKTCFRCRLHALYEEIGHKHGNEPKFMLVAMAEACGSMLSQLELEDFMLFMFAVQKFANEDIEGKYETKH